jgi:hypothetical protein
MKNNILWLVFGVLMLVISVTYAQQEGVQENFNKVWKTGYVDGWCYNTTANCIQPIPPIPPLPRIKDTTYTIIYNRGFIAGLKAKKKNGNY